MTIKTDGAGDARAASVTGAEPPRTEAAGAKDRDARDEQQRSFADVMRRKSQEGGAAAPATSPQGHAAGRGEASQGAAHGRSLDSEREALAGAGDSLERPRRGGAGEGDDGAALVPFRIGPSILHPPADIGRPTLEKSGVVAAAQAIVDRVVESARLEANPSGRLEFVLETKADVLGGAEIRVRIEDGRVHAVFASARPEVRAALESQTGALREALVARGLSVGELTVAEPRRRDDRQDRQDGSRGGRDDGPDDREERR